ncbi:MAG: hypothetical protein OXU50_07220 [Gammaproteobacteria bacterium]|nr:hypothetical protein [Gammaproteobacteria bacterium]
MLMLIKNPAICGGVAHITTMHIVYASIVVIVYAVACDFTAVDPKIGEQVWSNVKFAVLEYRNDDFVAAGGVGPRFRGVYVHIADGVVKVCLGVEGRVVGPDAEGLHLLLLVCVLH